MGLDNRARAVPTPPLRSCGYWEEQRSAVTATAWRPLSLKAPEQALSMLASAFRARIGRKARKGCALPQVAGVGAQAARDCLSVRIYASELCPRQDSNLRSRLRRPVLFTAATWQNAPFPPAWGAYGERRIAHTSNCRDPAWRERYCERRTFPFANACQPGLPACRRAAESSRMR